MKQKTSHTRTRKTSKGKNEEFEDDLPAEKEEDEEGEEVDEMSALYYH